VFIMGIPQKDDPKTADIVLVTAGHVLYRLHSGLNR
jgi:hypothetical protein